MNERLSDVEARIANMHQLSSVITAMRGIAAARLRQANAQLAAMETYAATIDDAISQVLAAASHGGRGSQKTSPAQRRIVIALCAEQGFAGAFNSHILAAAQAVTGGASELMLVGDRGVMIAGETGLDVTWSTPMAAHLEDIVNVANRLTEALYSRLPADQLVEATIVHAAPDATAAVAIASKRILPFDFSRFSPQIEARPPVMTLPPPELLSRLAEEYVFAELTRALILSFAAENEARMRAMIASHENITKKQDELSATARLLRQEHITSEVTELATGMLARKKLRQ